jgi:hypothetical protein
MRKLVSLVAFCATASLGALAPAPAQAESSMMQPMGDYTSERLGTNGRALLFGGGMLLIGSYGTSALVGVANERKADEKLIIPIVGPWLNLGDRQCDRLACGREDLSKAALIASGILQGVGFIGMVGSLFVAERPRRPDRAGARRVAAAPRVVVTPAPFAGGPAGRYGLALVGTFLARAPPCSARADAPARARSRNTNYPGCARPAKGR